MNCIIIIIIIIIVVVVDSCHRPFLRGTSVEPAVIPTAQASHYSTFRTICKVPNIVVFCSESIECLPGISSKFFLKLLVTIPVAPVVSGIIVHFRFHICFISIHRLLYFNFFSASSVCTFLSAVLPHLSVRMFSLFCF